MSINLGFLIFAILASWKLVDIVRWALSADWHKILDEYFD